MKEHHILVIDDDERLRVLLRRFLEESGFRVTDAGSAQEARRILKGMAFDILVVDVMMPGETGIEFLADLRKGCLLYTSPSPRDGLLSRMPSSA